MSNLTDLLRLSSAAQIAVIAIGVTLASGTPSAAKNCGGIDPPCGPGAIPCACGDTVADNYVLTSNLDCSGYPGPYGLRIASGKTLTMGVDGIQIIGANHLNSVGVLFDGVSGATLVGRCTGQGNQANTRITGWGQGVQLTNGATNNTVQCIESAYNGTGRVSGYYGFDLRIGGTSANVLRYVYAHDNADEGVHFGGGSFNNRLEGSLSLYNANTQVYLTNTSGTTLYNNGMRGPGIGGIRLVSTSGSLVDHNAIVDADLLLDQGSSGNTIVTTDFLGFLGETGRGRIQFRDGVHDNVVNGVFVGTTDDHCIEFSSDSTQPDGNTLPYGNRVTSSDLSCSGTAREIISEGDGQQNGQNYVCNTTCRNQAGGSRACTDSGTSTDDVRDDKKIITVQSAACP